MNPYKNTLSKVKALLKEDDNLTKNQSEVFQWQLLIKVPGDFVFNVGKGGVNTIFYSLSSEERVTCYPEDVLELLEQLAKTNVFVYAAYDSKKNMLGYSINIDKAKEYDSAKYLVTVNFKGKKKLAARRAKDLYGGKIWKDV